MKSNLGKILWLLIAILTLMCVLGASSATAMDNDEEEADSAQDEPGLFDVWGVSIQPKAFWSEWMGGGASAESELTYHMRPSAFTSYEGNFWHRKSGWRLGVNAGVDDNVAGDVYDFMISAGYKNVTLRMQAGAVAGYVEWGGVQTPQTPRKTDFKSGYSNIDVLWYFGFTELDYPTLGTYAGLSYTSLKLPVYLRLVKSGWEEYEIIGRDVYQKDSEIKIYSLVIAGDNMNPAFLTREAGGYVWYSYNIRVGYSSEAIVRKSTLALIKEVNPAAPEPSPEIPLSFLEVELNIGGQYVIRRNNMKIAAGMGYAAAQNMLFTNTMASDLGLRSASGDAALETGFGLIRHGPVIKALVSW